MSSSSCRSRSRRSSALWDLRRWVCRIYIYVIIQLSQPLVQLLRPMGSKERGVSQAAIHIYMYNGDGKKKLG